MILSVVTYYDKYRNLYRQRNLSTERPNDFREELSFTNDFANLSKNRRNKLTKMFNIDDGYTKVLNETVIYSNADVFYYKDHDAPFFKSIFHQILEDNPFKINLNNTAFKQLMLLKDNTK